MALASPAASAAVPMRLGVFGGTFDPIHIGHLILAEEARARLGLERVLFVPANVSPLKVGGTLFSNEERYRMVQMAIADNPHFCVSRLELERGGPSYTVDTLRALQASYGPDTQLYFIMGMDSLMTFAAWHRPREIIRLTKLVVVHRPGYQVDWPALEREVPGLRQATEVIATVDIGISSTDLRQRLREGLPIKYQVPASVEAFILEHYLVKERGKRPTESCC